MASLGRSPRHQTHHQIYCELCKDSFQVEELLNLATIATFFCESQRAWLRGNALSHLKTTTKFVTGVSANIAS